MKKEEVIKIEISNRREVLAFLKEMGTKKMTPLKGSGSDGETGIWYFKKDFATVRKLNEFTIWFTKNGKQPKKDDNVFILSSNIKGKLTHIGTSLCTVKTPDGKEIKEDINRLYKA